MLLIPSFSIKKLNLFLGKGLVKMSASWYSVWTISSSRLLFSTKGVSIESEAIDADEDITLVNDQDDADKDMFNVIVLGGEEVFAAVGQNEIVGNITTEEITLAQALEALTTSKPKVKGIVIQEQEVPDQIRLDEEAAKRLQAEFDKEERLVRERERERAKKEQEANIALIETWDDIQAKIDVDHQLAQRMQAQEQKELSDAEKDTLFP
nr:hypothetical protein [Tanacetum cinerariifolium]